MLARALCSLLLWAPSLCPPPAPPWRAFKHTASSVAVWAFFTPRHRGCGRRSAVRPVFGTLFLYMFRLGLTLSGCQAFAQVSAGAPFRRFLSVCPAELRRLRRRSNCFSSFYSNFRLQSYFYYLAKWLTFSAFLWIYSLIDISNFAFLNNMYIYIWTYEHIFIHCRRIKI